MPCWDPCRGQEPTHHIDLQIDARDALAALIPEWASDTLLLVGEGLTFAEIAALRGVPIGGPRTSHRLAEAMSPISKLDPLRFDDRSLHALLEGCTSLAMLSSQAHAQRELMRFVNVDV